MSLFCERYNVGFLVIHSQLVFHSVSNEKEQDARRRVQCHVCPCVSLFVLSYTQVIKDLFYEFFGKIASAKACTMLTGIPLQAFFIQRDIGTLHHRNAQVFCLGFNINRSCSCVTVSCHNKHFHAGTPWLGVVQCFTGDVKHSITAYIVHKFYFCRKKNMLYISNWGVLAFMLHTSSVKVKDHDGEL